MTRHHEADRQVHVAVAQLRQPTAISLGGPTSKHGVLASETLESVR
jgi:hypothetical protein